ncbi:hypothetical protein ACFXHA_27270 [Nocardia sp. NPDC059240]|uniref:hypothetical protein n=1 Tax=Nocardia sp. NPDC059240 TaxID=3346786 RepID=UPI00368A41A1
MTDWLDMSPEGVRQQADSFQSAATALGAAAGSWNDMFAVGTYNGPGDLGDHYAEEAHAIAAGFGHLTEVVRKWASACEAFEKALQHSAGTVQSTDEQFSGDIAAIGFDGTGGLTIDGK